MSQSMTGFAARPRTDVLPMCLIAEKDTPDPSSALLYSFLNASNGLGQSGSYGKTSITAEA